MKKSTTATTEVLRWRAVEQWNVHFTAQNIEANPARCNVEASRMTSDDGRFLRAIGIAEE